MFSVMPARVQYWVEKKMLLTKGGRITESSLSKFLNDFPEKIPYESLSPDMRNWLQEMGYRAEDVKSNAARAGNQQVATLSVLRSIRPLHKATLRTMDTRQDEC